MSLFEFKKIVLENYRCFERLELPLEKDLTVLFAENGGGKTALLNALAAGIALFQQRSPSWLKIEALRDTRKTTVGDSRQRESTAQYQTCLTPPPGPPCYANGKAQWDQNIWPVHIHPPRNS